MSADNIHNIDQNKSNCDVISGLPFGKISAEVKHNE